MSIRTIAEICADADKHKNNSDHLRRIWFEEVHPNKDKYSLKDLLLAQEHFMNYLQPKKPKTGISK